MTTNIAKAVYDPEFTRRFKIYMQNFMKSTGTSNRDTDIPKINR
jgi:hypothetical protein